VARISRKELRKDEIRDELAGSVGYLVEHRNTVIIAAVLAIVVGAGLAFYLGHRRTQKAEARKALQDAIEQFHGQVNTEQRIGMITFTTTIERRTRTTEAFDGVKQRYAGTPEADAAEYYLALLDAEEEKYQEAQPKLESAIRSSDDEIAGLARLALAEVYVRLEKEAEAREQYQYLVDHPTRMIPKERAQLALARFLIPREPERAKEILNELILKPGVLGGAATASLRELSGS
jgi:predicted negative regulator of RcsB-dependent stress response